MSELEYQYMEYIEQHAFIGNGDMLIVAAESGRYLKDFCDTIGITVEQFEEMV